MAEARIRDQVTLAQTVPIQFDYNEISKKQEEITVFQEYMLMTSLLE